MQKMAGGQEAEVQKMAGGQEDEVLKMADLHLFLLSKSQVPSW